MQPESNEPPLRTLAAAFETHAHEGKLPCSFGIAMSRVPAKRWNTRADLYESLSRSRAHLESNFVEPLNLQALASVAGVSPFHFQRLFKEFFGSSPSQYRRKLRLSYARKLIDSGMSITEACFEVGFQSPSTFARLFRREFGCSPSQCAPTR